MKSTRREEPPTSEVRTVTKKKHDSKVQVCQFHFHIHSGNSAYYALYKVTNSALKHSVTLSCRVFSPRLRDLYIDLIGKMIVCDTWYKFLESTEIMEMVKFIYFFALFVMSNKKLKIQDQKHQSFNSISPPVAKKILSPQSSSLPL